MEATYIVHWPGQDTAACDEHFRQLVSLSATFGFALSWTPCEPTACDNCENARKKGRAG
jgi:hypothetical protein